MHTRTNWLTGAAAIAVLAAGTSAASQGQTSAASAAVEALASVEQVPLIPRDALFGNPTRVAGAISPNGRWLSWRAPHNG